MLFFGENMDKALGDRGKRSIIDDQHFFLWSDIIVQPFRPFNIRRIVKFGMENEGRDGYLFRPGFAIFDQWEYFVQRNDRKTPVITDQVLGFFGVFAYSQVNAE